MWHEVTRWLWKRHLALEKLTRKLRVQEVQFNVKWENGLFLGRLHLLHNWIMENPGKLTTV